MKLHWRRAHTRKDGTPVRPAMVRGTGPVVSDVTDRQTGKLRAQAEAELGAVHAVASDQPPSPGPQPPGTEDVQARPLHRRFRHISGETIDRTRDLFDRRTHTLPAEEATAALQDWVYEASTIYRIEAPAVRYDPTTPTSRYDHVSHTIVLKAPNVVKTLELFRVAHLHRGARPLTDPDGKPRYDIDPRAWATSLYYAADPPRFRRLALNGQIRGVEPEILDKWTARAERLRNRR